MPYKVPVAQLQYLGAGHNEITPIVLDTLSTLLLNIMLMDHPSNGPGSATRANTDSQPEATGRLAKTLRTAKESLAGLLGRVNNGSETRTARIHKTAESVAAGYHLAGAMYSDLCQLVEQMEDDGTLVDRGRGAKDLKYILTALSHLYALSADITKLWLIRSATFAGRPTPELSTDLADNIGPKLIREKIKRVRQTIKDPKVRARLEEIGSKNYVAIGLQAPAVPSMYG
jgi:hypothetical protein